MLTTVGPGYWWECRGRNLIQARMPMATSSQGENRTCTAKLRTVRAAMAMRTRAMIAGMVIGLHSWLSVVLISQGCRRRLPASIRISPGSPLRCIPESIRANPDPVRFRNSVAGAGLGLQAARWYLWTDPPGGPRFIGLVGRPTEGGRAGMAGIAGHSAHNACGISRSPQRVGGGGPRCEGGDLRERR